MASTKYLAEDGVRRLWAAIEQKFIDADELAAMLANIPFEPGTIQMEALTMPEIDAITGYSEIIHSTEELLNKFNSDVPKIAVTIGEDLNLDSTISIEEGKTVIVTLEKEINNPTKNTFVVNGGTLVINGEGGSITGASQAVVVNSGSATINGGTYTTTSAGQVLTSVGSGAELTLNNVTANGQEFAAMAFDGATLNINGGEFTTNDNAVFGTNGTAGRGGNTIVIKDAKINGHIQSNGYEACGIYIANNDTVVIEGNTEINVDGGCGILMRGGDVTVKSGVKITTTAADQPGWVGDNKTKMSQSGIIYHESANYPGKAGMKLTVEDGVIFDVAGEDIEILSNEATPNVHIG